MTDIIDRIMQEKADHVAYLKDLFKEMTKAGFADIRIDDRDLCSYSVNGSGVDAVIREMFQVDDLVTLRAAYPRHAGDTLPYDEPHRVQLTFILENDAWECLADFTIPCQAVDEKLSEITDKLERRYLP